MGDFGACDYAVASRFQATHAARHNTLVARGERRGHAIAIHWPLWQDGGMGFRGNTQAESFYLKSSGQRALRAQEGLDLFEKILRQDNTQHLVLVGQPERVRRFLAPKDSVPTVVLPLPPGEGTTISRLQGGEDGQDKSDRERGSIPSFVSAGPGRRANMKGLTVAQCVALDLAELTSQLLQIPRHRLDPEANLADFGFDSISLSEFAALLTTHFEPAGLGLPSHRRFSSATPPLACWRNTSWVSMARPCGPFTEKGPVSLPLQAAARPFSTHSAHTATGRASDARRPQSRRTHRHHRYERALPTSTQRRRDVDHPGPGTRGRDRNSRGPL